MLFFSLRRGAMFSMALLIAGGAFFGEACVGDEPATNTTDDGSTDTSTSATDSSSDGGTTGDGAATTTYAADLADESRWEKFDVAPLANAGFIGGAFDGRYVYYVPNKHTTLLRYDTQMPFGSVGSWDAYDLSAFNTPFDGALFAGQYLYLIPSGVTSGTLVRFDTHADFKTAGSYTSFDMTRVNASDHTFSPGAYDGKFAYFGPAGGANAARLDTTSNFEADASYQSFAFNPAAYYTSTCFDGKNIYFVPAAAAGTGQGIGTLRQYSTTGSFTAGGSYSTFDTAEGGVDPKATGFKGCAFDGKYLYLEPYGNNGGTQGFASLVVRYDTTLGFTDVSSYSKFDLSGVDANAKGFSGSTFDGRYLYFAPFTKSTAVRFDTTGSFGDKGAWQSFDLTTTLTAAATAYAGAIFDGEHVYFVPNGTTLAVRFDAKSPASLPTFSSSFY